MNLRFPARSKSRLLLQSSALITQVKQEQLVVMAVPMVRSYPSITKPRLKVEQSLARMENRRLWEIMTLFLRREPYSVLMESLKSKQSTLLLLRLL